MQKKNEKKVISIPLFGIILVIMIITILALSIKTICFSNNTNEDEQVEEVVSNETEETKILANKQEKEEQIEKDSIEKKQNDVVEMPKTNKVKTYTSSNGKTYDSIGILNIPSLNIEYPILSTTNEKNLKVSLTKYWGGNPNEVGNLCISGHNYKNSKFFGKLQNIKNGDIIQITDFNGNTLDYKVYNTYIVDPDDTSCTSQLTNGKIEITLITCYYENGNAHATKRFIVKARV